MNMPVGKIKFSQCQCSGALGVPREKLKPVKKFLETIASHIPDDHSPVPQRWLEEAHDLFMYMQRDLGV